MSGITGIGSRTAPTYNANAAPVGYVAGVGRGAMGFTTRSDIGPARMASSVPQPVSAPPTGAGITADSLFGPAPVGYVAGRGRGMGDLARSQEGGAGAPTPTGTGAEGEREGDYSESNYDSFAGYSGSLFANYGAYEEDDREADQIYAGVDEAMENRRKRVRERQMVLEQQQQQALQQKRGKRELSAAPFASSSAAAGAASNGSSNTAASTGGNGARPRIADQFADLKRELGGLSAADWESIPDVGDYSLRLTQSRKKESFLPLPDSLLALQTQRAESDTVREVDVSVSGTASVLTAGAAGGGVLSTLHSEVRGSALSSKLDALSSATGAGSAGTQSTVDPRGYLTSLDSLKLSTAAEIGDIKRARALLQSVTQTNPSHGPGWIAAARVEELANKLTAARKLILSACEHCAHCEDVWLEAVRLHMAQMDLAKAILANAVTALPHSVKLWLKAVDLETTDNRKKAVLRRALEQLPQSVQLWKTAVELETANNAKLLLYRAVECVPQCVEMWLALAKLETHEAARKVLNRARDALPQERAPWITAAQLEEAHGNHKLVKKIVEKMVASLQSYQVHVKREDWLQEAIDCERSQALLTCTAIIDNTLSLSLEGERDEDQRQLFLEDAEHCLSLSPIALHTARAISAYVRRRWPAKKSVWLQAAMMERDHGDADSLENILLESVKNVPQAEVLWLMAAKQQWQQRENVPRARAILMEAFAANPQSEEIYLAAAKLEWENEERERARAIFTRARDKTPSERVYIKSVLLEIECGETERALSLLTEALQRHAHSAKLYLMAAQTHDARAEVTYAKECGLPGKPEKAADLPAFDAQKASKRVMEDKVKARNLLLAGIKQCSPAPTSASSSANSNAHVAVSAQSAAQAHTQTYADAQAAVSGVIALWVSLIRLEERVKGVLKARPTAELARAKTLVLAPSLSHAQAQSQAHTTQAQIYAQRDLLFLESIRLERRAQNTKLAHTLQAQALQEYPRSGALWADLLLHCAKTDQRRNAQEALKRCGEDARVALSIARLFERSAHARKARKWYNRAQTLAPRLGDVYVYEFAFEFVEVFKQRLLRESVVWSEREKENEREAEGEGLTALEGEEEEEEEEKASETQTQTGTDTDTQTLTEAERETDLISAEKVETIVRVARDCVRAQPNRGELWCATAKETALRRANVAAQLLVMVERVLSTPVYPAVRELVLQIAEEEKRKL